ncbi:MAG: YbhN family protein [Corynebacterium sp.]|uniref:lysylphosphatidylglycerol synthase transmembrane domain-containing protein n=1 Tax=Corynebacterium sp. TaxID=1720 RepID=UPI0026E0EAF2|nr:YbhN family protein [Corynebacterium sp.]MDO5669317.1 YbhN family protein [Corynebacterium sp.]
MWRWVRWLAPLAILIVLAFAFRDQMPFLGDGARRLREASPWAVGAAVLTAGVSIVAMAEVMRLLLSAGGTRIPLRDTTAVTLASNSWSTTLPGGPAFSAVLTYQVQRSWGASRVLCGWFLILSSAVSTMWLVLIGIAGVFFLGADVNVRSLLLTLAAMTLLSGVVYWASNNPDTLNAWTRGRFTGTIHQLDSVRLHPGQFALISGWSLLNRALDVATLYLCVWAISDQAPAVAGVLLAYTTAKIAGSAQVTPGGLGTVEAAIIATLVASGMTAVDATGAALIYRLVSFALITAVGWVVYFLVYARRGLVWKA